MAALLAGLAFLMGPLQMLKLYLVPYWVFVMWLDFVTYLRLLLSSHMQYIICKMQVDYLRLRSLLGPRSVTSVALVPTLSAC